MFYLIVINSYKFIEQKEVIIIIFFLEGDLQDVSRQCSTRSRGLRFWRFLHLHRRQTSFRSNFGNFGFQSNFSIVFTIKLVTVVWMSENNLFIWSVKSLLPNTIFCFWNLFFDGMRIIMRYLSNFRGPRLIISLNNFKPHLT